LGYKYGGDNHDVKDDRTPSPCGTYPGYRRHRARGETACPDCKAAMAAYSRSRYTPRPPKGFTTEKCGTWPGRRRHDYYNVPPCEPCKAAARAYQQQRREAKQTKN